MADRKKVIKAAEICLQYIEDEDCPTECPYFDLCAQYEKRVVFQPLIRDALELLKEQEAVKPLKSKLSFTHGFDWEIWDCGCCGNQLRSFAKYCDQCGRAVKWDD